MIDKIKQKIVTRSFFKENDEQLHHQKIVFTNGCFDVLHYGHVHYLAQARQMGDLLVVGLNSDASVRRLKGEGRPVNSEQARAYVLAALEMVDYVCLFEEDTPYELIAAVQPDVLVKGGDYSVDNISGSNIVLKRNGKVCVLPFVEGFSSTSIIEKINK